MEDKIISFAQALRRYRKLAKATQKALARMCGISRSYKIMLEKADAPPPSDPIIIKLENSLGLPQNTLMTLAHLERSPRDIRNKIEFLSDEMLTIKEQKKQLAAALLTALMAIYTNNDYVRQKCSDIINGNETLRSFFNPAGSKDFSLEKLSNYVSDFIKESASSRIEEILSYIIESILNEKHPKDSSRAEDIRKEGAPAE